jgi:hypothetical protein
MVKKWRSRWLSEYDNHRELAGQKKHFYLANFLKDNPRSGSPKKISKAQEQSIVALACKKPRGYGIEITDWTLVMLSKVAASKEIVTDVTQHDVIPRFPTFFLLDQKKVGIWESIKCVTSDSNKHLDFSIKSAFKKDSPSNLIKRSIGCILKLKIGIGLKRE